MKKFLFGLLLAFVCLSFAYDERVHVDKTILRSDYFAVYVESRTWLAPFSQRINGEVYYGFVNACISGFYVSIEASFEEMPMLWMDRNNPEGTGKMWIVKRGGKYGAVYDNDLKMTVPCVYDSIEPWKRINGKLYAKVKQNGQTYYINHKNEKVNLAWR